MPQMQIDFLQQGSDRPRFDKLRFNGDDYKPELDNIRLGTQIFAVYNLMKDGKKRTLQEIASTTGYPESSVSAQLRHLRKVRFGAHDVRKERVGEGGTYLYWIESGKSHE